MTNISGDRFSVGLQQLFQSIQQADPQGCIQEVQKFGQALGADQVHQLVNSFASISGDQKSLLRDILLGQSPQPLQNVGFIKEAISSELQRQVQMGMLQSQLGGIGRMALPAVQLNQNALSSLREGLGGQIAGTLQQISNPSPDLGDISALSQKLGDISSTYQNIVDTLQKVLDSPQAGPLSKMMADSLMKMAGFSLMKEIANVYPQVQQLAQQLGGDPSGQMMQGLGNALGQHLNPDLLGALQQGQGQPQLGDVLGRLFQEPSVVGRMGQYLGDTSLGDLIEKYGQLGGANIDSNQAFIGKLGEGVGNLLGTDLGKFIPQGIDFSNPKQAINDIAHKVVDGFLFDKENGLGLEREYKGSWSKAGNKEWGWGDEGARDILHAGGIGYGEIGKTLWEGKFGGFDVGAVDARAEGDWGSAYAKGKTTFLEASARAFGDIDPSNWSAMIGAEARAILVDSEYSVGYKTPRIDLGGHQVGLDTNANFHGMVGAEGRVMADISLKDDPHLSIGGEAFAGARARLDGDIGLNVDGKNLAAAHGGVEGWAGIGAKAGADIGYKDGTFSFDFDLGVALGIGFELDFGFDVNVGAIADTIADVAGDVGGAIADGAEAVGGAIADGAEAVGGAIADGAEAVGGAIADGAEAVGDAISSVFSGW